MTALSSKSSSPFLSSHLATSSNSLVTTKVRSIQTALYSFKNALGVITYAIPKEFKKPLNIFGVSTLFTSFIYAFYQKTLSNPTDSASVDTSETPLNFRSPQDLTHSVFPYAYMKDVTVALVVSFFFLWKINAKKPRAVATPYDLRRMAAITYILDVAKTVFHQTRNLEKGKSKSEQLMESLQLTSDHQILTCTRISLISEQLKGPFSTVFQYIQKESPLQRSRQDVLTSVLLLSAAVSGANACITGSMLLDKEKAKKCFESTASLETLLNQLARNLAPDQNRSVFEMEGSEGNPLSEPLKELEFLFKVKNLSFDTIQLNDPKYAFSLGELAAIKQVPSSPTKGLDRTSSQLISTADRASQFVKNAIPQIKASLKEKTLEEDLENVKAIAQYCESVIPEGMLSIYRCNQDYFDRYNRDSKKIQEIEQRRREQDGPSDRYQLDPCGEICIKGT